MYIVNKIDTDIFGLKYRPQLTGEFTDDMDSTKYHIENPIHFSKCNAKILLKYIANKKCIVEIGVHAHPGGNEFPSSTELLINNMDPLSTYIGIDLEDRSFITSWKNNVHFVRTNSTNYTLTFDLMDTLGIQEIDLLMIDGWHSVSQIIKDWAYVNRLSIGGVVLMHDTNRHPGPNTLYDAIDSDIFDKQKFCDELHDYGISVATRKK